MRRAPNELCSSGFDFEAHEEDNRCSEACREGEEKEKKKVWKREKNKNQSKGLTKQKQIFFENGSIVEGNQKTRKKSKKSLTKQNKELNLNYDR